MTVAVVMGSESDFRVMEDAVKTLQQFGVANEVRVLSAHRTPEDMIEFGKSAVANGYTIIIAGAGGAAHLPGMLASVTTVPVIGVPISLSKLDGMDSLLSIVQMPRGVPVAAVAIDNATNAALLAVRILSTNDERLRKELEKYRDDNADTSRASTKNLGKKK